MATVQPIDIFNMLTPSERQQVLQTLRREAETPCQKQGHKYRPAGTITQWFGAVVKDRFICERCGKVIML